MHVSRGANREGASVERLAEWQRRRYKKIADAIDPDAPDKKLPLDMLADPAKTRRAIRSLKK